MNALQKYLAASRIPLWVKLLYTAFTAVLVPVYLYYYGPANFLYFCDIAVVMTLVAVWWESALWASAPLVGIMVPQLLWMVDFCFEAVGGKLTGMTHYMFKSQNSLFLRGLSFFHFWLPWFLIYVVWKIGFDRRAFLTWGVISWVVLYVCYFHMPEPPPPPDKPFLPVNINYVYGFFEDEPPQTFIDGRLWFGLEVIVLTFAVWLPTHLVMCKLFRRARPIG